MKIWKEKVEGTNRYVWHGDGTVDGRRLRPRNLSSKAEVEAVFDLAKARRHARRYDLPEERPVVFLSELLAERLKDLDLKRKSQRQVKTWLENFRNHLRGDPPVDSITTKDIISFKRARLGTVSPRSLNNELVYVGEMLRRVGAYFPALATWKPPAIPYEPVPQKGRERVVTRDEAAALLAELRAPRRVSEGERPAAYRNRIVIADLWELAPHVGMRTTELRLMEKGWVDLREEVVRLPAHVTKGKRAREVPLNEPALAVIRRRMLASPHPRYLFNNASGTNAVCNKILYSALHRAAARARLPYGQHEPGGFRPHDNRHTFVTDMLQSGADAATVGDIVGHSKTYMTLIYSHPTRESKRRAVENLARVRGEADKKPSKDSGRGAK